MARLDGYVFNCDLALSIQVKWVRGEKGADS